RGSPPLWPPRGPPARPAPGVRAAGGAPRRGGRGGRGGLRPRAGPPPRRDPRPPPRLRRTDTVRDVARLETLLAREGRSERPLAVLDLDAVDANAADLVRRAAGTPVRIASKSL